MPTPLQRLYRFTAYNEEGGPSWSVASTPIEMTKRLYRIMYKDDVPYEQELTIDISRYKQQLSGYKQLLEVVSQDMAFCEPFRLACRTLLQEDPWLVSL
jgi:hypothetical protein